MTRCAFRESCPYGIHRDRLTSALRKHDYLIRNVLCSFDFVHATDATRPLHRCQCGLAHTPWNTCITLRVCAGGYPYPYCHPPTLTPSPTPTATPHPYPHPYPYPHPSPLPTRLPTRLPRSGRGTQGHRGRDTRRHRVSPVGRASGSGSGGVRGGIPSP